MKYAKAKIDEKGRITIPAKFREKLSGEFYISYGFDRCLYVFSLSELEKHFEKLSAIPIEEAREYLEFFRRSICRSELDKHGRALIVPDLQSYAGFSENVIIAVGKHCLEIWDAESI